MSRDPGACAGGARASADIPHNFHLKARRLSASARNTLGHKPLLYQLSCSADANMCISRVPNPNPIFSTLLLSSSHTYSFPRLVHLIYFSPPSSSTSAQTATPFLSCRMPSVGDGLSTLLK